MSASPFALVTLDYPPEHGGVARYLGSLVEESRGELEVYVPETHACVGPGQVQTMPMFASGPWPWRRLIWGCRALRAKGHSHLLLSHVLPVGTAAWLARLVGGLPYSVIIHGLDIRLAALRPHRRWLAGKVLQGAAHVIANSRVVAEEARRAWPNLLIEVMTPGVEPRATVSKEEARRRLSIDPSAKVCLTVARLVPRKGMDMMIRVLERHPDWRYVVVGAGVDELRLRDLAEMHAPGRVQFLTAATDEERDAWYAAADLFVFLARETEADIEGFGIAPLEAGLVGLPVLAGRSGGVVEAVVDGETGLLVDPQHIDAIDEAFTRLATDEGLRVQLGEAGRARARAEFAWEPRWQRLRELMIRV